MARVPFRVKLFAEKKKAGRLPLNDPPAAFFLSYPKTPAKRGKFDYASTLELKTGSVNPKFKKISFFRTARFFA